MRNKVAKFLTKPLQILLFLTLTVSGFAQDKTPPKFWDNVQFGGGFGLAIGSGFSSFSVAPTALYNFNNYLATGVGLQYSSLRERNNFSSQMYGVTWIGLVNPIEEVQVSLELEQLRVNLKSDFNNLSDNFWNTGLFLGAGYRVDGVTIGFRYNVLFRADQGVYGDAFMPFVRAFF
jgi:hypothetical protein